VTLLPPVLEPLESNAPPAATPTSLDVARRRVITATPHVPGSKRVQGFISASISFLLSHRFFPSRPLLPLKTFYCLLAHRRPTKAEHAAYVPASDPVRGDALRPPARCALPGLTLLPPAVLSLPTTWRRVTIVRLTTGKNNRPAREPANGTMQTESEESLLCSRMQGFRSSFRVDHIRHETPCGGIAGPHTFNTHFVHPIPDTTCPKRAASRHAVQVTAAAKDGSNTPATFAVAGAVSLGLIFSASTQAAFALSVEDLYKNVEPEKASKTRFAGTEVEDLKSAGAAKGEKTAKAGPAAAKAAAAPAVKAPTASSPAKVGFRL